MSKSSLPNYVMNEDAVSATVQEWDASYREEVWKFTRSRTEKLEDADDAYGSTVLKLMSALHDGKVPLDHPNPRALFFVVAKRTMVDSIRREQSRGGRHLSFDETENDSSVPDLAPNSSQICGNIDLVDFCLAGLEPEERDIVTKHYILGWTMKEIALETYGPEGEDKAANIGSKIYRILGKIRRKFPKSPETSYCRKFTATFRSYVVEPYSGDRFGKIHGFHVFRLDTEERDSGWKGDLWIKRALSWMKTVSLFQKLLNAWAEFSSNPNSTRTIADRADRTIKTRDQHKQ